MSEVSYTWGDGCEAWKLTDTPELAVIREKMPPGTSEKLHYHNYARQLFYILEGTAQFTIDEKVIICNKNEHLSIEPSSRHKISNIGSEPLEFIVVSHPRSHGDRIDLE